jgi:hypothetical protein
VKISIIAQVKYIAFGPGKTKDWEDDQSYGLDANQRFINGVCFSGSMALDETMPHMLRDHESWVTDDENHVKVPNFNEMISMATLMIRAIVR